MGAGTQIFIFRCSISVRGIVSDEENCIVRKRKRGGGGFDGGLVEGRVGLLDIIRLFSVIA